MATFTQSPSGKSLISVEPAVVRQIVVANGGKLSLSPPTTISTSAGTTKRPIAQSQKVEKNLPNAKTTTNGKSGKTRNNNTLRRVKNSKEVLRDRTTRSRTAVSGPDILATLKEGRNFTVGNVGTGGIIYLRSIETLSSSSARIHRY